MHIFSLLDRAFSSEQVSQTQIASLGTYVHSTYVHIRPWTDDIRKRRRRRKKKAFELERAEWAAPKKKKKSQFVHLSIRLMKSHMEEEETKERRGGGK